MRHFSIASFLVFFAPMVFAYQLERVGGSISHPWGVAVLNDTEVLITARAGALLLVDLEEQTQKAIRPLPTVFAQRQGGMLDVETRLNEGKREVYLCYSKPMDFGRATTAVARGILKGAELSALEDIFVSSHQSGSGVHFGCRLAIQGDFLFVSLGDRGDRENAQNPDNHAGSVIRLDLSGQNRPANNQPDWQPELYSIGHRNPQGLAINPVNQQLYAHEHGPRGGDEINLVKLNANYGWPEVSYGKEYIGGEIGLDYSPEGFTDPLWIWDPSIAPSGMHFYTGDMFPEWQGDLLVGALKFMSLYQVEFDENQRPVRETRMLEGEIGRIRDVAQAKDGSILLLSDAPNGGLYRLSR